MKSGNYLTAVFNIEIIHTLELTSLFDTFVKVNTNKN